MVQDELLQVATREREAATQHQRVSLQRGEGSVDQDKWRSDQLVSAHLPELAFCAEQHWEAEIWPWKLMCLKPGLGLTSVERMSFQAPEA